MPVHKVTFSFTTPDHLTPDQVDALNLWAATIVVRDNTHFVAQQINAAEPIGWLVTGPSADDVLADKCWADAEASGHGYASSIIPAIKLIRERHPDGIGLPYAKDLIDAAAYRAKAGK